ncbi:hypothetical protein FS749_010388 [Ceratobasidium sp. UAMH 11750]|nr:hypothetical protein FS749_010388 [Ceratobasidium sp. UAMH 11750]
MFPLGLPSTWARMIPGYKSLSTSPSSTPVSLPDTYDVGLNYDWSGIKSPGLSSRYSHYSSVNDYDSYTTHTTPSDYNSYTNHTTPSAPSMALPPYSSPTRSVSAVTSHADLMISGKEIPSMYGNRCPMYQYQYGPTQARSSSTGSSDQPFLTPRSSLFAPLSPTPTASSRQTRPYFVPSRSSTPVPPSSPDTVERIGPSLPKNVHSSTVAKRKAREIEPEWFEDPNPKKRRFATDEILTLSDDEEGYGIETYDTGYQCQRNVPNSGDSSSNLSRLIEWTGPNGGQIKFFAKPTNYDEDALSRWSFSVDKPESDADERVEGDIHFSPAMLRSGNDPFAYWVCVWQNGNGPRWVRFQCGQQHPHYRGFVLQSAQAKTRTPPHWVKETSFKSSRRG